MDRECFRSVKVKGHMYLVEGIAPFLTSGYVLGIVVS